LDSDKSALMASSEIAEAHIDKSVDKVAYHKGRTIDNTGAVVIHKPDGYYRKEFGKKSEYLGKHVVPYGYEFSNEPTQSPALPLVPAPSSAPSAGSSSHHWTAPTSQSIAMSAMEILQDYPNVADALSRAYNAYQRTSLSTEALIALAAAGYSAAQIFSPLENNNVDMDNLDDWLADQLNDFDLAQHREQQRRDARQFSRAGRRINTGYNRYGDDFILPPPR
jgi:hypothetical protein